MTAAETRAVVAHTAQRESEALANRFYEVMMADPEAGHLLDHQLVNERLRSSMRRWVVEVFDETVPIETVIARQQKAGEVHARLGVQLDWVSRGARVLKRSMTQALVAGKLSRSDFADAVTYVHEMIDLAISRMNSAYAHDSDRQARSDESYRLFFMIQNLRVERERQKARLLEWSQEIFVRGYQVVTASSVATQELSRSAFGLWLEHKASMLFEGAPELDRMRERVREIEVDLLPRLTGVPEEATDARAAMTEIAVCVDDIKALLNSVFDRYEESEEGRDGVTQLLSRRYLPSVAKREIAHAARSGRGFGMLVVEADDLHSVRQVLGVENSGPLEAQLAATLVDCVRAGDFMFRIGEDRFLAVIVETDAEGLLTVARGIRRRVLETRLQVPGATSVSLGVRVGAAVFDGHPDYQRLIDRAAEAAQRAGVGGLEPCVLAE